MAAAKTDRRAIVIAVYPDHALAEDAVRRLQTEGIPTQNLILPGIGSVVIAGPSAAALLGGVEGALAGAALGGLTRVLVGLGISKDRAIRYESQVKAGKFVVTLRDDGPQIECAKSLFSAGKAETTEVVPASAA
jgi:hypothetical protein